MTTSTREIHVPGTGAGGHSLQGVAAALYRPAEDASPYPPYIDLSGYMEDVLGGGGCIQFSVPGWQAFIAAVKAGEFDGMIDGETS